MVYLNDVGTRDKEKINTVMLDLYSRKERRSDCAVFPQLREYLDIF